MLKRFEIEIDERLYKDLEKLAEGVEQSISMVVSGMCVKWYAEQDAALAAKNGRCRPLFEFSKPQDIEARYSLLRSMYDQEHRREWEEATKHAAEHGAPLTEEQ